MSLPYPEARQSKQASAELAFAMKIEDSLHRGDAAHLVSALHHEGLTSSTLTRLDQLVTKDLCGSSFSRVLVVLKALEILSQKKTNLQELIDHGLTAKVLSWFEAVYDLLTSHLHKSSTPLISLTEGFYDYFLLLGQSSLPVSQLSVVLLHLARVSIETEISFRPRLEAIRTFNTILGSISRKEWKLIQNDENQNKILAQVAETVLIGGDYELQVSLSEALCRLTPRKKREEKANQWFPNHDISTAFCDIKDRNFEGDCRCFLNLVNRCQGDQRRVYTFPCLTAFLDSTQLFQPDDDTVDEFWIDFNLGSECVSFFVNEPQGFLWDSIHLLRDEVDQYSLHVKDDGCTGPQVVLRVQLNIPIFHHTTRGQRVELSFSCEHHGELEEAARRVFRVPEVNSSPEVTAPSSSVQAPSPLDKHSSCSYSRKKPQSKSRLKILPLSPPSSEDDDSVTKTAGKSRAELLFDQIRHSTPTSGVPVRVEQSEEFGASSSVVNQPVSSDRKRAAADSGYLSDQLEGSPDFKRKVEPQPEREESNLEHIDWSPEGVEPTPEEEGQSSEEAVPIKEPGAVSASDLTSDITATFKSFKDQLQQRFTICWQKVEQDVLRSLKDCQQHVSSLLGAVHTHRLSLLQSFERSITEQLKTLEENSTQLNIINTQILSFFQSEMQRLGSFCEDHVQRLKSLENTENLSSQ